LRRADLLVVCVEYQTTSFDTAVRCSERDRRIRKIARLNSPPFDTPERISEWSEVANSLAGPAEVFGVAYGLASEVVAKDFRTHSI
jgi:hypothetical protein